MSGKSVTQQVAENIGAALMNPEVMIALMGNYFRPIVRESLAIALGLQPDDLGPEIVEEALTVPTTAVWLAKQWLDDVKIPETISHLNDQYGEKYEGFGNETNAKQVALNMIVTNDEGIVLTNAVRDGLLKAKT